MFLIKLKTTWPTLGNPGINKSKCYFYNSINNNFKAYTYCYFSSSLSLSKSLFFRER